MEQGKQGTVRIHKPSNQVQGGYFWLNRFIYCLLKKKKELENISNYLLQKKKITFLNSCTLGGEKPTLVRAYLALYSSSPAVICFMWAELFNWPEHGSFSQTDISSRNLSHLNPQESYTLDKGQRKSTNEHGEYNPLVRGLSCVSVLSWKILLCPKLRLLCIIQQPKCNDADQRNNSPTATKDYCTSIWLQQLRDLLYEFGAVA